KNTIVIMTSNIGSPIIQEYFKSGNLSPKDHAAMEERVRMELRGHFRPEFLNRVDEIIIFHSLSEAQLTRIVDIQLKRLEKRISKQTFRLRFDGAAKKSLAQEGYDPKLGARPLKRTIQEELLDPLAMKLLDGKLNPGDQIRVTAADNELILQSGQRTAAKST